MFEFVSGPLVWLAFIVFAGGCAYRLGWMFVTARKDRVVYPYMSLKYGLRSLLHWIVPFASVNMRKHPVMTVVTFLFHICLIATPVLLTAHVVMLREAIGLSWWTLPPLAADIMTIMVLIGGVFFIARRIRLPEVRNVTDYSDYLLIAVVLAPFATGFIAHHQFFAYKTMVILHIVTGVLWLIAIPFTRLAHMLYFVFTRMYMGSEFGFVRNARDW
ncbi:MAG: nitrate reductase [Candidatus Abyssobacteria bacterium SURF_5]|uniref:Nitrate reductase n=1 Tax=Abyssobacteria bacterium (strain SURF_5) TaxID=2093360 RepID=A0A3A4P651_ABYX5|nr:MAG: nitrate reductase [Candidatus Abyssubacteria bacterium SURF_5]